MTGNNSDANVQTPDKWMPTPPQKRVLSQLAKNGEMTRREIRRNTTTLGIRQAIDSLQRMGIVKTTQNGAHYQRGDTIALTDEYLE